MKMNRKITILGSGIALGVYVPALRLRDYLINKKYEVEVIILEELFTPIGKKKLLTNKQIFHSSFRIAKKAHQIAADMTRICDTNLVERLFNTWEKENQDKFVIVSGYWGELILEFQNRVSYKLYVDCIHMDAVCSNSWKRIISKMQGFSQIWPFDLKNCKVTTEIPYIKYCDNPMQEQKQIVIHGGGWGMGLLDEAFQTMKQFSDYRIYRVAYHQKEYEQYCKEDDKVYYMDEEWIPWSRNEVGELSYPQIWKSGSVKISLDDMLYENNVIISKPGGGTLMDSIVLAKPIIFLNALSEYEEKNKELWENLNFGISMENWKNSGFSYDVLDKMQKSILRYQNSMVEMEDLLCSLKQQ